jgi:hypothetical protein
MFTEFGLMPFEDGSNQGGTYSLYIGIEVVCVKSEN